MNVWIVYEANSIVPKVFTDKEMAYTYRTQRVRQVRHQVYIAPGVIEEGE